MMRILKNLKITLLLLGLKELKLSPVRQDVTVLTNGEPTAEIVDVSVNEHPKVILPV